jgi:hypothetical protein
MTSFPTGAVPKHDDVLLDSPGRDRMINQEGLVQLSRLLAVLMEIVAIRCPDTSHRNERRVA